MLSHFRNDPFSTRWKGMGKASFFATTWGTDVHADPGQPLPGYHLHGEFPYKPTASNVSTENRCCENTFIFFHTTEEKSSISLFFSFLFSIFFLIQFCFRWNCPHLWKILWDWCLESITQVWRKEKVQSCVAGVIWQRRELRSSCKRKVVSCCPYTNRSPARLCMTVTYGMRPCASRRNQVMRSVQHNGKNRTLLQLNVMLINATSLFFINKIKLNLLHSS